MKEKQKKEESVPKKRLAITQEAQEEEFIPTPKVIWHVLVAVFFQSASVYLILESVSLTLARNYRTNYRIADVLFFNAPVVGAYLADNVFGVYLTINFMQPISILINASLLVCHVLGQDDAALVIIFISMFILGALGNLYMTLGCDQYHLPNQKHQFTRYVINYITFTELGKIIGRWTFILFVHVNICVGERSCYPIQAIGVASAVIAMIAIFVGMKHFVKKVPSRAVRRNPGRVIGCFFYAIYLRCKKRGMKERHWMDPARIKFGRETVYTIKETFKIFGLFSVLPLFSCLRMNAQEFWIVTAAKMNTNLFGHIIYPAMLVHLIPFTVIIWLFFYRFGLGNLLIRMGFKYPLQYMILGGFLVIISFLVSIILASIVETTQPPSVIPEGEAQVRFYNPTECTFSMQCIWLSNDFIEIPPMNHASFTRVQTQVSHLLNYSLFTRCNQDFPVRGLMRLVTRKATGYFFRDGAIVEFNDSAIHSKDGFPLLRLLANVKPNSTTEIKLFHIKTAKTLAIPVSDISQMRIEPGDYTSGNFSVSYYMGDVAVLLYNELGTKGPTMTKLDISDANTVSMTWLVIQHLVIGLAQILIEVHGTRLSYIEAPDNKKSTFLSYWTLITGVGTMLTWVVDFLHMFLYVAQNLILLTLVSLTCVLIFSAFAMVFDYNDPNCYF